MVNLRNPAALLACFLGKDGGIKPIEGLTGIGSAVSEGIDQVGPAFIVIDENVTFLTFNQCENVVLTPHGSSPTCQNAIRSALCRTFLIGM
jgi:hypothetical protein